MDVPQRLMKLETKMEHLDKCMDETKSTVKQLQRTIWIAHGALAVLIFIAPLVWR